MTATSGYSGWAQAAQKEANTQQMPCKDCKYRRRRVWSDKRKYRAKTGKMEQTYLTPQGEQTTIRQQRTWQVMSFVCSNFFRIE